MDWRRPAGNPIWFPLAPAVRRERGKTKLVARLAVVLFRLGTTKVDWLVLGLELGLAQCCR